MTTSEIKNMLTEPFKKPLMAENKRIVKVLRNMLGKGNFNASMLDEITNTDDLDANLQTVYGSEGDEAIISNLKELWRVRRRLGFTKRRG